MSLPDDVTAFVRERFEALADPAVAAPMAAYMKSDQPFYGVKKPDRVPVNRELKERFAPPDRETYEAVVLALWSQPHREEQYTALEYATAHERCIVRASMGMYERMIREGAWWDLVDWNASKLVGRVWRDDRAWTERLMDRWIDDDDLWIRRSAIIGQLRHKEATDADRLFRYCRERAHEREFFIRKAIGWALRSYARVAPEAVRDFLVAERPGLSGLSYREASRNLVKAGVMSAD